MLGQGLRETFPADAVVGVGVEDAKQSAVRLQHGHAQRHATQFVDQNMAAETRDNSFTHSLPKTHLNVFSDLVII